MPGTLQMMLASIRHNMRRKKKNKKKKKQNQPTNDSNNNIVHTRSVNGVHTSVIFVSDRYKCYVYTTLFPFHSPYIYNSQ